MRAVLEAEPGSYRDPSGQVFRRNGRIFRTITERAAPAYEFVRDRGLLTRLADEGKLVSSREVDPARVGLARPGVRYVLEHDVIPFISHPYEWPFAALKAAALHHLDLQIELLTSGSALSDASAYNIQFRGPRPVFIDVLSLRPYRDGEYWAGHRQFCEQFLNPLLLRALTGVAHNAWYRGSLEGIPTTDLARLVPAHAKTSWNVLTHVVLQARLHRHAMRAPERSINQVRARQLSKAGFEAMLHQLRRWVAKLAPADRQPTLWADYAKTHSYASPEFQAKRRFVADFAQAARPRLAFDLGCNTGDFSAVALEHGARLVIGFDADQHALDQAFARASTQELVFLPLVLDAANPSPSQGWQESERAGFARRARADAILALAFEHHMAIGRNIPLDQLLEWLVGLAPCGVIEFVPKSDPTVQRMLALREDIFEDYHLDRFKAGLLSRARLVRSERISQAGRELFWYDRS